MTKLKEAIILIHGLSLNKWCMKKIAKYFKDKNYFIINFDYPSRKYPIDQLVKLFLIPYLIDKQLNNFTKVHFITHSMGGIIVRYYLNNYSLDNLSKVIMLCPPNKGSELVDKLDCWLLRKYLGPAFLQLSSKIDSFVNQLSVPDFNLGIIMGNKKVEPFFSKFLPTNNDGVVSIDSAIISNKTDFLILPVNHLSILYNNLIPKQIEHFINQSKFY